MVLNKKNIELRFFTFINRDKAVDESSSFFPKDVFEKSSAAYHQLHAIPQSPWPKDEHAKKNSDGTVNDKTWNPSTLKREVVEGVGGQGKLLKIQLPVLFPQKSILSSIEQRDYLFAIIRVMKAFMLGTPTDQTDVKRIRVMHFSFRKCN